MCRMDIREASIRDVTFVLGAMVLVVVVAFIYIKRYVERSRFQITTVAGLPYGQNVSKAMFDEIEECLTIVASIRKEPQLLASRHVVDSEAVARLKTVDGMKQIDAALEEISPTLRRRPFSDVRRHLCDTRVTGGPLKLASLDIINDFVSLYEHARYDPGRYGPEKFEEFSELLKQLLYSIQESSSAVAVTPQLRQIQVSQPAVEQERLLPMLSAARRPLLSD